MEAKIKLRTHRHSLNLLVASSHHGTWNGDAAALIPVTFDALGAAGVVPARCGDGAGRRGKTLVDWHGANRGSHDEELEERLSFCGGHRSNGKVNAMVVVPVDEPVRIGICNRLRESKVSVRKSQPCEVRSLSEIEVSCKLDC